MNLTKSLMESWLQNSKYMLEQNQDMETILGYLREDNCPIGYSIIIWHKISNVPFDRAKVQVQYSQTWRDQKEIHDRLHDRAYEALNIIDINNNKT